MQQILYDEAPYAITFYYDNLQAYRSDKFTNFVSQPTEPAGPLLFQYGVWSYMSVTPVGEDGAATDAGAAAPDDSGSNVALIAGLAAVVVLGAGAVVLFTRRRSGDEDVE